MDSSGLLLKDLHTHQTYVGVCISKESNSFVLDIPYLNLYLILRHKKRESQALFSLFLLCIKSNAKLCEKRPALGPPFTFPSLSPGILIQRYASTNSSQVWVVGNSPIDLPYGLKCSLLAPVFR